MTLSKSSTAFEQFEKRKHACVTVCKICVDEDTLV